MPLYSLAPSKNLFSKGVAALAEVTHAKVRGHIRVYYSYTHGTQKMVLTGALVLELLVAFFG